MYEHLIGKQVIIETVNALYNGVLLKEYYNKNRVQLTIESFTISSKLKEFDTCFGNGLYHVSLLKKDLISVTCVDVSIVNNVKSSYVITEANCRICTRKNDIGVSKCWNCECGEPC